MAVFKEKNMKRTISLGLGLLSLALLPLGAQAPATGKVHGHVTNPTGASQSGGTISAVGVGMASGPGLAGKTTDKGTATVTADGDYTIDVPPGNYRIIYRTPGMPEDKEADHADNVKVTAGQDTLQDIDMSRKEYIDAMPADQRKQLEDLRKHNSEAMKANEIIKGLNNDLKTVTQDIKDADGAPAAAAQTLGTGASKADVDAKVTEIRTGKYTEIETLMTKDTTAKPDASVLWAYLGQSEAGLKKWDAAETAFKKALDLETTAKKPNPAVQGLVNSGLGEVYARQGKVPEANAAYDAAVKADPTKAGFYLKNEAVIFSQSGNADAQVAAAEEGIKADPTQPILYYLKGNGLVQKTTMDDKTHKLVAPPGCLEAYQKYLELAPTGPYAEEVKGILAGFNQTIDNTYKAPKGKKS
jgi:tetratricopeptide (TPR) repeat protein